MWERPCRPPTISITEKPNGSLTCLSMTRAWCLCELRSTMACPWTGCRTPRNTCDKWQAFIVIIFAIWKAFSANPLYCGYRGLNVEWTNPHVFVNWSNTVQENCGPLSENTCPGITCLARIPFIFMMMNDAWVE